MIDAALSLLGLWVLLAAVWLAAWPLLSAREPVDPAAVDLQELVAEKDRLIAEIHELDLDRATGKLSAEDHARQEARLKSRAVAVMRRMERLHGG